jgi:hypothetical protein
MKPILYREIHPAYKEYTFKFPLNKRVEKVEKSKWMKMKELVIFFLKTIGIFKFKGER